VKLNQLEAGDCLLVAATEWIGQAISDCEGSPWVHAAMIGEDPADGGLWVYEMTWPQLKRTPLGQWVSGNACWVAALRSELDCTKRSSLWSWWNCRLGRWYDVPELLELAPVTLWCRICAFFGIKGPIIRLQPIAGDGVCSANVAWAWQSIGLPVTDTSGMTPADIPNQPFVGPVEQVVA
jgi:hypothetical protein